MQIEDALAIGGEHLLNMIDREIGEILIVPGALDHHLVRANPVHLVVEPLAAAIQRALDLERGASVHVGRRA